MSRKKRNCGLPEEVLAVPAQLSEPGAMPKISQSERRQIRRASK